MQGAPLALVLALSLSTLALLTAAMTGGGAPAPSVPSPQGATGHAVGAAHAGAARPWPHAGAGTGAGAGAGAAASAPAAVQAGAHQLALADDGRLIADHALRAVMDGYLSQRDDARRLQSLDAHLSARLPARAAGEARQLAAQYDAYLARHADLLQAQQFATDPDVHRLGSWLLQRRQLRQQMLGPAIAEQWFGTEEAYLQQALDERRLAAGNDAAQRPATDDERRHAAHMRQAIAAATGRAGDDGAR